MASKIEGNIYRVSVDSERSFVFVNAKDREDLIRFLVREYDDPSRIYGAKEIGKDGSLTVVPVVTDPLFRQLSAEKQESPARTNCGIHDRRPSIDDLIRGALAQSKEQCDKSISPEIQAKMDSTFKENLNKHLGAKPSQPER